jgi:uncharacterized membrane protein YfcA
VSVGQHVLAFLVMLVGAAIQGAVGFGSNLVAAPLLVLIDPKLVPGPAITASFLLNMLVIRRERAPHAWREVAVPIVGQIPGAVAGAAVLALVAKANLAVFFSLLILVAVGVSASGLHPPRTRVTLTLAGLAAGFMGTAVGIGGPPMALLYQRANGPEIRAALSRFFGIGGVISLVMLTAFGQFHLDDLLISLSLMPGTVVGYLISGKLLAHVDAGRVRVAVLSLSGASAVVALVRALL